MAENFDLYWKIVGTVAGAMFTYHKYITAQLEKKVDKDDCYRIHNHDKEMRTENSKTLFKSINKIEERLARIEEQLMKGHSEN